MISQNRVVPLQEDLTKEDLRLNVLRGHESMFRVDKKFAQGESLQLGEWGCLQNDGTVARPGATPVAETYLVFCGNERFDAMATGQVTLIMNSPVIIKTNRYNQAASYSVGSLLSVKDLGAGEANLTLAAAGEFCVGKVQEVGSGYLIVEVFAAAVKA
jgi:hypothetical protein